MSSKTVLNAIRALVISVPVCLIAVPATAQTRPPAPDLSTMSMEDLLGVEVVTAASKFPQEVKEAPASITIVTADEIHRYGHRTLADVLRSVRGFYTSYDRNYSYVGFRGFGRPGDYNTRVLLLIDGHRLNDPLYDMAPIGTDFPIDVSLIERVEVIRGPGSSLYGTNAVFAVINVVTRTAAQQKGIQAETFGGSLGTRAASVSVGHVFGGDRELLVAGSLHAANGAKDLYYPEYDQGRPGQGIAADLDHDQSKNVFGSLAIGRFSFAGAAVSRRKQVPTGAFDAVFGDDRLEVTDDRAYLSATYESPVRRGWSVTGRLGYDYYGYEGVFPFDYGEPEPVLWLDHARSHVVSGEITTRRRFAGGHLVTMGAEVRNQFQNSMSSDDNSGRIIDIQRPGAILGAYVQDEVRVFPWLLLNAGARVDRYPTFGSRATPRAGLVLLPRTQTAIKVMYGRAFRAPNPYEAYYYPEMTGRTLEPEVVRNTEVVWEEYISNRVRTAVTAFRYQADKIIEQAAIESDLGADLYFRNAGGVEGTGFEAEVEVKLARGVSSRFSHSYVRARDLVTHAPVSNSPSNLSKLGLQIPVAAFFVGIEGQYVGERLTLAGQPLSGFFVPNVILTSPQARRVAFTFGIYNVFDHAYSDPGAEEHLQQAIPQDGRSALARLRVRF
jgi:outer membrane receptor for ferrienterochelin and colicins